MQPPGGDADLRPEAELAAVGELRAGIVQHDRTVDLAQEPGGGRSLIERVLAESRVPVLAHLEGNCHTYLHASADPEMAVAIAVNAKLRRTGVCGATETLLVDAAVAEHLLPPVLEALIAAGCAIRGDALVRRLEPRAVAATEQEWRTEDLDAILAVKTVAWID